MAAAKPEVDEDDEERSHISTVAYKFKFAGGYGRVTAHEMPVSSLRRGKNNRKLAARGR